MNSEDLLKRTLPKWPAMLVTGTPVSVEQAKEIIRRTDRFFLWGSGNDAKYAAAVIEALGMPTGGSSEFVGQAKARAAAFDAWRKAWGLIETEYVYNDWVLSCFAYGANGWCHPDGKIGSADNVGKYPTPPEVMADWELLAGQFPFLDLGISLFSGEECEPGIEKVVSFSVAGGMVAPADPERVDVHRYHPPVKFRGLDDDTLRPEKAIPWEWIEEWAAKYKKESH